MNFKPITLHTLLAVILMAAGLCCVACSDDNHDKISPSDKYFLQLVIDIDAETRAGGNPNGGENGDGSQPGSPAENTVNDALVLLYQRTATSDIETNPHLVHFAHCLDFTGFTWDENKQYWKSNSISGKFSAADYNKEYRVITLVNLNSTEKQYIIDNIETLTLKDLRDRVYLYKPWEVKNGTACNFVMTSEKENDRFTLSTAASNDEGDSKIIGSITVRRLAARIDVKAASSSSTWVTGSFIDAAGATQNLPTGVKKGYLFNVKTIVTSTLTGAQTEEDQGNRFLLTDIKIENDPQAAYGTYYIKRTTPSATNLTGVTYVGTSSIFGYEKSSSNAATNWVIDPHSTAKHENTATTADYSSWYQTTTGALTQSKDYFTTAYTMENTTLDNSTAHATAIVFEGYELKGYTQTSDETTTTTYRWEDKKKTYRYLIRHSDPDGSANASKPMLYGVVRNNIYRFTLSKVLFDEFNPVIVVEYWDPNNHIVSTILVEQIKDMTDDWNGAYPNDAPLRR